VVAVGIFKLLTCFAAALLAIAPWGVESGDILASVRAALFGFRIGDVTISFSAVVAAATVFGIGIFLTRSTQRWLDEKLLPRTDLDSGLRNSIRTALGYAGVVVAGALAISSLGLSLDRIAIIAGALSVGIGFGLQSIVNNFVSGLILLWERPIRVGDLIDVGGDQGIVRRINVRSTEVETFDRATVIMPNSNLVSGVVKNRVHSDRTGRVLIALNVPRSSDPDAVAAMLAETAAAHGEVMRKPPPIVNFKKIGDAALEFELVCCVFDVDDQARVASDLHFDIFRKLGPLLVPAAPAKYAVEGAEEVAEALRRIADALGEGPRKAAPSAAAKPA
jgi:small-conductance mechanosensitive channel